MEDKQGKRSFNQPDELRFTKEDREEVFEKIGKMKNDRSSKQSISLLSKRSSVLGASLLVGVLCLFLFAQSIFQGNLQDENSGSTASEAVSEESESFTTLITLKAKEMDNRIYVNLVLTYNKDKKKMKFVSIPSETYAPIIGRDNGTASFDKLLYAYNSGGADNVQATVSKLLDLPIDYYGVMDLETFSTVVDSVGGIEYDLREDLQARAITQAEFDFEKGEKHLNGEEVAALMMAAAVGNRLNAEDQVDLFKAVIDQAMNELSPTQLKEVSNKIEGNIPFKQSEEYDLDFNAIESISLIEGMKDEMIDGAYYITFEEGFLNSVSHKLTTFKLK